MHLPHAGLRDVVEGQGRPVDVHMALADRGQAEGAVTIRVLLRSDPERRPVEQAHGGRHHAFLRGTIEAEVTFDPLRRSGNERANDSTRRNLSMS